MATKRLVGKRIAPLCRDFSGRWRGTEGRPASASRPVEAGRNGPSKVTSRAFAERDWIDAEVPVQMRSASACAPISKLGRRPRASGFGHGCSRLMVPSHTLFDFAID